ncbi:hypothetical protein C8R45DRAFT_1106852 [Mycena sanguinolenta]|nr:hypothetical protein C8R45DRAFT_1106852 [Mycena sanguinolenta]
MFNFKALFTATLLAATATTAWGKAETVLYASTSFIYSGITQQANSIQFYTDGVEELYYYYPDAGCGGPANQTTYATKCIVSIGGYKSFEKGA